MAEALGVGASVVAFVGLAGQVAQGVAYLYNFFGAIQNAPADVRSLTEELKVLSPILDDIRQHGYENASIRVALEQCNTCIEELEALVSKSKLTTTQSRARKIWSQMNVAFRSEKFQKHTERLERAKLALIPAQNEAMHHQRSKAETTIQESISKLTLENSVGVSKLSEASSRVETELQNLPTHVTNHMTTEVSQLSRSLHNSHSSYTTLLTEVKNTSIRTEQHSKEINNAIQSLLGNSDINHIVALLQPALEKVVSDRIDAAMKEHVIHLEAHTSSSASSTTMSHEFTQFCTANGESSTSATSLSQLSSTVTCSRREQKSKIIQFWFGRLHITTSMVKSWQGCANSRSLQKSEFVETKVTLIPSSWLLRTGVILTVGHVVSGICSPSIQMSFVPLMILADNHPIMTLIECGDLPGVRRLIESGQVRTSSLFPDGSNLLLRCIKTLSKRFEYLKQGYLCRFAGRAELDMAEIAEYLVEKGIETDVMDLQGNTSFLFLTNMLYFYVRFGDPCRIRIEALVSSVLRASESSLLTIDDSNNFIKPIHLIKQLEHVYWTQYPDLVVEASMPDHRVLNCLAALHAFWKRKPYVSKDLHDRSDIAVNTLRLMKTAILNKVWLAGDVHEEEICLRLLYESILGAFVRASPYNTHQSLNIEADKAAEFIAEMLRFDEKMPTLAFEFGPLTSCAARWRVLDIWKLELEKAGYHPFSVFGNGFWESNAHLYEESVGYVSNIYGSIVSMSVDSSSGRVCLAVDEMRWNRHDKRYQVTPEVQSLIRNWTFLNLPRSHCEVYQLPAHGIKLDDYQPGHVPTAKPRSPESQYNFKPTEDGGIEMFIDCCEVYEPYEVLCAEIEKEREAFENKPAEPEEESRENKSGILSKVVSAGATVLSSFV